MVTVPDDRFERLLEIYHPKKAVPTKIELFDTPGLSRSAQGDSAHRLSVIRSANALVQIIGLFSGSDPDADISAFMDDLLLADLQVVNNRIERLKKDVTKPRPDRDDLQSELQALGPIADRLSDGEPVGNMQLSELQEQAAMSFSLLTRKPQLVVLNTSDSDFDPSIVERLEADGQRAVAAPAGLELELQALSDEERAEFAIEMGLKKPFRGRLLRKIFELTNQITFYTCADKEVHAWLLRRGATVLEAADTIHSDLARGFVRAEVWSADDLIRLGSERDLKAAGLQQLEGKDYIVRDGDEIFIRSGI